MIVDIGAARPSDIRYRITLGRFKWLILSVVAGQLAVLAVSVQLNSVVSFLVGIFSILVGFILWLRRQRAKDLHTNLEGVRYLGLGNFDKAAQCFDALCASPHHTNTLAVFVMNRATTAVCAGQFEFALSLYWEVLRAQRVLARGVFKVQGDVIRARCADALACYGKLDMAQALLDIQKTHTPETLGGIQLLARSVITLRRGQFNDALQELQTHWTAAESVYTATELKALIIVRAFALHNCESIADYTTDARVNSLSLDDVVRNRWLGTHWSDMRSFVETLERQFSA